MNQLEAAQAVNWKCQEFNIPFANADIGAKRPPPKKVPGLSFKFVLKWEDRAIFCLVCSLSTLAVVSTLFFFICFVSPHLSNNKDGFFFCSEKSRPCRDRVKMKMEENHANREEDMIKKDGYSFHLKKEPGLVTLLEYFRRLLALTIFFLPFIQASSRRRRKRPNVGKRRRKMSEDYYYDDDLKYPGLGTLFHLFISFWRQVVCRKNLNFCDLLHIQIKNFCHVRNFLWAKKKGTNHDPRMRNCSTWECIRYSLFWTLWDFLSKVVVFWGTVASIAQSFWTFFSADAVLVWICLTSVQGVEAWQKFFLSFFLFAFFCVIMFFLSASQLPSSDTSLSQKKKKLLMFVSHCFCCFFFT